MSFEQVAAFIEQHAKSTKDKDLLRVLQQVALFVGKSDKGFDMVELKTALCYLGVLPVQQRLLDQPRKSLIHALRDKEREVVFDREFLKGKSRDAHDIDKPFFIPKPLSAEATRILSTLYALLLENYHDPVWRFQYPPGAFKGWESSMAGIGVKNEALPDVARDVTVNGVAGAGGKLKEAGQRVDQLVAGCDYSPETQERFATWIKNNGGQKMMSFLVNLIKENHFSDQPNMLMATQNFSGWSARGDKLIFDFNLLIGAVSVGDKHFVMGKSGVVEATDDMLEETMQMNSRIKDINAELRLANKPPVTIPSVLQLKGSMELALDDFGNVGPKVASLKVLSFTPELLSPARKFDAPQNARTNHHTPRPK